MSRAHSSRSAVAVALLLPALALGLFGCGMPGYDGGGQPTASSQPEPEEAPAENTVATIDLSFVPEELTVAVGTTVRWVNSSPVGHTVTSGEWGDVNEATGIRGTQNADGLFDHALSPEGGDGDTFEFTFTEAGEYPYFCKPHLAMNGVVIVE